MATLPKEQDVLVDAWGPHLNRMDGVRVDTGVEPDKIVSTHCCFCGQQCGINLKVKDNLVIGFEPRYDFPFNKGMLCPKGVKRYLQGGHPDRLTTALQRDPSADGGFSAMAYDAAIARVASEIERIQSTYGPNAFGVLSGASLTTEKAYLMGKFARVCLKTKYIDYNGRLCMVSAGAANKKAFGIDRSANPWDDILNAEVVLIAGSNTAECSPITTNYVWQARENGGKLIVVDPRITPIARTADIFLPVKPGRDVALFNGILHLMIENDWIDHSFIEQNTVGFEAVAEHVQQWTPKRKRFAQRPSCGERRRRVSSCTRAASSITRTAWRTVSPPSTSSSRRAASGSRAARTARSSVRATDRAAASTGRRRISFPAGATS
jgi:assimilatory nitrate reductase catalytic subunit